MLSQGANSTAYWRAGNDHTHDRPSTPLGGGWFCFLYIFLEFADVFPPLYYGAMNPKVDWYFAKQTKWQKEVNLLRTIVLGTGLTEELKWGCPTYTLEGNNIVLIHMFKEYCALLFFKGVLMEDEKKMLIQQTKHVQAARQIRFTDLAEIAKLKTTIKAYVKQAVKVERSGAEVKMKKTAQFKVAPEWKYALEKNNALKTAFEKLTPGRQRGYLLYFSGAKKVETRLARIEKCMDKIFDGFGLDD